MRNTSSDCSRESKKRQEPRYHLVRLNAQPAGLAGAEPEQFDDPPRCDSSEDPALHAVQQLHQTLVDLSAPSGVKRRLERPGAQTHGVQIELPVSGNRQPHLLVEPQQSGFGRASA